MGEAARGRGATGAWWNDRRTRAILYQLVFLAAIVAFGWYIVSNTIENLRARGIKSGFDFLFSRSGLPISDSIIEWSPNHTFGRAYLIGIVNTLRVGILGIVLATILGTLIGVARLSSNWLIRKIATVYVETIRNVPLLLQLFLLYNLIGQALPDQLDPLVIGGGFYLSKGGLLFPILHIQTAHLATLGVLAASLAAAIVYNRWAKRRQEATGVSPPRLLPSLGILFLPAIIVFLVLGAPAQFEIAQKEAFRYIGGGAVQPEFLTILTGLVVYTAAFIAEIVRSGIQAVSYGQTEAASALGLTRGQTLRLVLLPQALRVIIPPMTSQYLNIVKNSSLAVAVGYPDVVAIEFITLNQTSRALEAILLIMAVYLTMSLAISFAMNVYNKRIALKER
ncbi:MAG: ABC transporter permease subunit [Rhodospirillaceae bacterium]|nr:ABC transporter permease subunit [Rhodospirillaceae bacterium]